MDGSKGVSAHQGQFRTWQEIERSTLESEPENVVPITDQQITEAQSKSICSEHSHKSRSERRKEIERGVNLRTGIPSGTAKCPQEEASAIQSHYNV